MTPAMRYPLEVPVSDSPESAGLPASGTASQTDPAIDTAIDTAIELDRAGRSIKATEEAYRQALELAPLDARLRGYYLNFLATMARHQELEEEWEASRELALAGDRYELIDIPLIAMLIQRAELDFALGVLGSLPHDYGEDQRVRALRRRALALLEARAGRGYVPGPLLEEGEWWRKGPFLVPAEQDGVPLSSWLAVHVEDADEEAFYCSAGQITDGEIEAGLLTTLTRAEVERWCGPVPSGFGRWCFIELGLYGEQLHGHYHERGRWVTAHLPEPLLEGDRFLRQWRQA